MLSKFKLYLHQKYLEDLPKISLLVSDLNTLYSPVEFREILIESIITAKKRICITALYLENDSGGRNIMQALHSVIQKHPEIDISILVDWHRAQRERIGETSGCTNATWYYEMSLNNPHITIPIYGIPVNTREALGILHLKGFIIDNTILYTGANLNDVYLHQHNKYRYDRYHVINNSKLADTMYQWIYDNLKKSNAVYRLDQNKPIINTKLEMRRKIRQLRQTLRKFNYQFESNTNNNVLGLTPLVGLGKKNILNKTIFHLMLCTKDKLIFCTPYFNLTPILTRNIIYLLYQGKNVEIIVGDKIANDFYISPEQPFKVISTLPYLYEIKLRRFLTRLQYYLSNGQLIVRLWKHHNNTYHLKGIWVDNNWMMITGNNLNPRAWKLDLENALLIHDPLLELSTQRKKELMFIRKHTVLIKNFRDLDSIADYPLKVRKLVRRLRRIHIDRLISYLL